MTAPRLTEDCPPRAEVERAFSVDIAMRDGIQLATDIYFPPSGHGPWPVILERTPYDKRGTNHADMTRAAPVPRSKPQMAQLFAAQGYVVILQDCRGRFGSEGTFTKYVNEGQDGIDTMAWIADQPWCNGAIATMGLSYSAHVQAAAAALGAPHVAAMILDSGGFSSAFHSGIRQGGAFELKQLTWALKHARLSREVMSDPLKSEALAQVDIGDWAKVNPWRIGASPLGPAPDYEAYVAELWAHEVFDSFWQRPGLYARGHYANFPHCPILLISSWYDPYSLTAIENYVGLKAAGHEQVQLILGPWTHGQRSLSYAGDVDFGASAPLDGNLAQDFDALRIQWLGHHVAGTHPQDGLKAAVAVFVMGGGTGAMTPEGRLDHGGHWRFSPTWPLPGTVETPLYLHQGGRADWAAASTAHVVAWQHDPACPVPTIGGALASGAPLMHAGAYDQRETDSTFGGQTPGQAISDRPDVVSFQTQPLAQDCEVTGAIKAELFVSSSAVDTDIVVRLLDIYPPSDAYPDGFALNLTHGILRLRFRDGFDAVRLMTSKEVYRIRVQAFPTSNVFKAGHRIGIDVASSSFPHFDVNPGNGLPSGELGPAVVATNQIHIGPDTPSCIHLPICPRPG